MSIINRINSLSDSDLQALATLAIAALAARENARQPIDVTFEVAEPANEPSGEIDPGSMMLVGETRQVGKWLLHRYSQSIRATDITNAGKRGKKCPQVTAYMPTPTDLSDSVVGLVLYNVRTGSSPEDMAEDLKLEALNAREAGQHAWKVELDQLRGVDVEVPSESLKINAMHFNATFSAHEFCISDLKDKNNEPTLTSLSSHGKRAVARVYEWAKANQKRLVGMTFEQIHSEMNKTGLAYHYYCAMD